MYNIIIRKAIDDDLDQIKNLADQERRSLGFITRATILQSIRQNETIVAEKDNCVIGFQMYHHRKDQQTTLYKKTVDKEYRRLGVGRSLVDFVVSEAKEIRQTRVKLKCPEDNDSNNFHQAIGFKIIGIEEKPKRNLNIYEMII